jgi:hypothetical protein
MNCVISIAEHELEMAHRWFDWMIELGTDGHLLHLIPSAGLDISSLIPKAHQSCNGRYSIIKDEEDQTSDWQNTEQLRSASGPNSAFRQVAWHFYHGQLGPYFWCELDCIPLRKDWLDRLETEYKSCGKPFMGAHVEIESVPEHMSGNAIYVNVPELAPGLVQRTNWTPRGQERSYELAFDIAGAREVLPKAHFTNLIQHKFRFKGFESRAEFDAVIDPNAVVFHSDKKGTIYKYLRENLSGGVERRHAGEQRQDLPVIACRQNPVSGSIAPPTQDLSGNVGVASRRGGSDEAGLGSPPAQSNLPVPVLADPSQSHMSSGGEARESTDTKLKRPVEQVASGTRGGQNPSTSCETTVVNQTFTPSDDIKTVIAQNAVIKNGLPAMSPPWENKEDTERDIKMLCDTLALFAKAPIYKSRVRQALREAKIIK